MAFPTITTLPSAPARTQAPDAFATTADAFVAALPGLVTEVNTAGSYIDTEIADLETFVNETTITVGNSFQGNYAAGTTYALGDSVLYTDGKFYLSLQSSNTGNTPDTATTYWVEIAGAAGGGAAGGTNTFTATGAISNGDLVSLNADGTVSVTNSLGLSPTSFNTSGSSSYLSACYDSNSNKVVVAYRDEGNLNYGTAVVGTVSGTTISFGTPVVFNAATTQYTSAAFDSVNNKVVISYRSDTTPDYGTAIVGTVSGTSISFGTPVAFNTSVTLYISSVFDITSGKVVISYRNGGGSNYGTAIVGTVSGTSISFGTPVVFKSNTTEYTAAAHDVTNNKIVIAYYSSSEAQGEAVVGTVSGTSISFGTPVVFASGTETFEAIGYSSAEGKVVIFYYDQTNAKFKAIIGTVSGTSISFGTAVVVLDATGVTYGPPAIVGSTATVMYRNSGSGGGRGEVVTGTISGTTIAFGNPIIVEANSTTYSFAAYDSTADKVVLVWNDLTDTDGMATVYNASSNIFDWIGVSTADITNGNEGAITTLGGINTGQTGLTAKSKYYLQNDATISTTAVTGREIGRATSATSLYITQGSIE